MMKELRERYRRLWERMVTHPFVREMTAGTLPEEKFRSYFLQDYVFVNDLVALVALGVAKAPDMAAAGRLNAFLTGIVDPENDLFQRAFRALGASPEEYSAVRATPTTRAFGDFLVRTGLEGSFEDVLTVLYVTEGTYLDWASRAIAAGRLPAHPIYREWTEIHGPQVLGEFVAWVSDYLEAADLRGREERLDDLFHTALRWEYLFWEAAYHGDPWPDDTDA